MEKRPTVHFSNRLEELANSLGEELFAQGSDPFATRIVLLPNHSLKLYLSSFLLVTLVGMFVPESLFRLW